MTKIKLRIQSKRRVGKLSATFFCALLVLSACKKEVSSIGESLQGENLNVFSGVDTFTVITHTEVLDSMESDETSINLLGYYIDPVFGVVDCGFATQIRLSSSDPSFAANTADVVVDSVVLSLVYSGIKWYGNLNDPITVEAYEITEDLVRDDQDYYTFDSPLNAGTNLVLSGSETIQPDVVSPVQLANGDSLAAHLRIRLDSTNLGYNLVNINGAGNMTSDELFVSTFKGLYIKVNGSSLAPGQGSVLYFSLENTLSKLVLYFHETTDLTPKEYSFNINSSAARYNSFNFDRTGTAFEAQIADSTLGQTEFYTQAGCAWAEIHFPYLLDIDKNELGEENKKIINKAVLVLPVQDFAADSYDPSSKLFIARIVSEKVSDFTLDYSLSSTIAGNTVTYDQTNKEYRFSLTLEIQAILNGERPNNGFRIYAPSFFASSIERVIFNGPNSPLKNRARLEVTYTDY